MDDVDVAAEAGKSDFDGYATTLSQHLNGKIS
jgi:hypothetical protein